MRCRLISAWPTDPARGRVCPHLRTFMAGAALVVGEQNGGGEVVGQTMRHFGEVGGRGRDHDQSASRENLDVVHLVGLVLEDRDSVG